MKCHHWFDQFALKQLPLKVKFLFLLYFLTSEVKDLSFWFIKFLLLG